jgi:hypothetical protein
MWSNLKPRRRTVRWVAATVSFLVGCFLANGATFHWWLTWGPPTPNPEGHRTWSQAYAGLSAVAFLGTVAALVLLRPRRNSPNSTGG